jgi:hypothetical protein
LKTYGHHGEGCFPKWAPVPFSELPKRGYPSFLR